MTLKSPSPISQNFSSLPFSSRLVLTLLGVGLVACTGDPEGANPETVEARLQSTLPALIDSSLSSAEFLETDEAWNGLMASVTTFDQVAGLGQEEEPLPAADGEDPNGQDIADMLIAEIFNADNYQGNGEYAVPGAFLCPDIEVFNETTFEYETLPDQECLDTVVQVEPRIHVETAGDGLDFALLIGPKKSAVLGIELRSSSLAVTSDLAKVKIAAEDVADVLDEEIDLPDTMQGVLAATLTVHGPQDVSVAFSIRQALAIAGAFPGTGIVSFSSEASDPLVEVRVNGVEQSLLAALDLGRTQLSMPWAAFDAESNATGTFALDWQGLSASVALADQDTAVPFGLLISNIGIGQGQSTVKLDEFTLLGVDLNKDAGRVFDLIMVPGATDELPVFRFDPGFDLEVAFDLSPLAAAGDEVPSHLLDETYRIEVDNGVQPVAGIEDDGLKAVDGAIRLESSAGTSIEVVAGQCLVSSELEPGEHELLGYLSAGPCPL